MVDEKLAEGWQKVSSSGEGGARNTLWKCTDEDGKTWSAVSRVEQLKGAADSFRLSVRLARGGSAASAKLE
jgi:hypothetical protein